MQLDLDDQQILLSLARRSIEHGLQSLKPQPVQLEDYQPTLIENAASFVTLNKNKRLRGCIGHLEATQPLVKDVSENAFAAAFQDPRFSPVSSHELEHLAIEISVLTAATPLDFSDEASLIEGLQPGIDGLILQDDHCKGTFLPSVWESLPTPQAFWQNLKRKAGLPADYWSDSLQVSRYRTLSFHD